jgi:hypothetical protein
MGFTDFLPTEFPEAPMPKTKHQTYHLVTTHIILI